MLSMEELKVRISSWNCIGDNFDSVHLSLMHKLTYVYATLTQVVGLRLALAQGYSPLPQVFMADLIRRRFVANASMIEFFAKNMVTSTLPLTTTSLVSIFLSSLDWRNAHFVKVPTWGDYWRHRVQESIFVKKLLALHLFSRINWRVPKHGVIYKWSTIVSFSLS